MFDFDPGKTIFFCAVALIVVGPKELPAALRFLGRSLRQLRQARTRIGSEFAKALDEADVEGMNGQLQSMVDLQRVDMSYHPATAMRGRSAPPDEGCKSAADNDKDREPSYASPEMALYLGALTTAEPESASAENVVDSEDEPEASIALASAERVGARARRN